MGKIPYLLEVTITKEVPKPKTMIEKKKANRRLTDEEFFNNSPTNKSSGSMGKSFPKENPFSEPMEIDINAGEKKARGRPKRVIKEEKNEDEIGINHHYETRARGSEASKINLFELKEDSLKKTPESKRSPNPNKGGILLEDKKKERERVNEELRKKRREERVEQKRVKSMEKLGINEVDTSKQKTKTNTLKDDTKPTKTIALKPSSQLAVKPKKGSQQDGRNKTLELMEKVKRGEITIDPQKMAEIMIGMMVGDNLEEVSCRTSPKETTGNTPDGDNGSSQ